MATPSKSSTPEVKVVDSSKVVQGDLVAGGAGTLYSVDASGQVLPKASAAQAALTKTGPFQYKLDILIGGKLAITQPVSNDLQMQYDKKKQAVQWIMYAAGAVSAWRFEFTNSDEEKAFKLKMSIALHETSTHEAFAKTVSDQDVDWVTRALENDLDVKDDHQDKDDLDFDTEVPSSGWAKLADDEDDGDVSEAERRSSRRSVRDSGRGDSKRSTGSSALSDDDDESEDDRRSSSGSAAGARSPAPSTKQSSAATPIVGSKSSAATESKSVKKPEPVGSTPVKTPLNKNNNLAVGMSLNRTYVNRGAKIGVFKHNDDDGLEYVTKISAVKTMGGELFTPAKTMLHQKDSRMLLLNEAEKDTVFAMDLHRGEVVEEWTPQEDLKIRSIAPTTKYNQLTSNPTLLGVAKNMLFTVDPRTKEKMAHKKAYQGKVDFQVVSAVGGDSSSAKIPVVTGSDTGEIRLFSEVSKAAKTLLPGLGDPIIGIDTTEDGKWVLATCESYLLVIPTTFNDDKKGLVTGFEARMGKNKPVPIKLQLEPRDLVKYGIAKVHFTPAQFNTGDNITEEWIVTSTGKYVITWNFRKIKNNVKNSYKIMETTNTVVAEQFRYNMEDQVVVTTPDNVYLERRSLPSKGGAGAGKAAPGTAERKKA